MAANIDQAMYLYINRDEARRMLGERVTTFCWLHMEDNIGINGYLLVWEFMMSAVRREPAANIAKSMASIALDVTRTHGDGAFETDFPNLASVEVILIGTGADPFVPNPMWGRLNTAITALPGAERTVAMAAYAAAYLQLPAQPTEAQITAMVPFLWDLLRERDEGLEDLYRSIPGRVADIMYLASLIAIANRGAMTDRNCNKVVGGFAPNYALQGALTPDNVRNSYNIIRARFSGQRNVGVFFRTMQNIFPQETHLRMSLVLQQAANSGVAAITLSLQGIRVSRTCPVWAWLRDNAPGEWAAFTNAVGLLAADPYVGFDLGRNIPAALRSTLYPAVTFAGISVLTSLNPQSSAGQYRGVQNTTLRPQIAAIVMRWVQEQQQAAMAANPAPIAWEQVFADGQLDIGV